MEIKALKIANILIALGIGLLLVGIGLSYPTFQPYLATLARTSQIATAPPLESAVIAEDATVFALLPFEAAPVVEAQTIMPAEPLPGETPEAPARTTPAQPAATPALLDPTPEPPTLTPPPPTATPGPVGVLPERIRIPAIRLDAPVVPIDWEIVETNEGPQGVWQVPNWRAAGWHETSAPLGVPGNTVLNGHNTTYGEVFRDLYRLREGAEILVEGANGLTYTYTIEALYILREAGQPLEVRLENARYILPTTDERLTLVTCHPYGSLQNRLIVIARPIVALAPPEGD